MKSQTQIDRSSPILSNFKNRGHQFNPSDPCSIIQ